MNSPQGEELERICAYCEHATLLDGMDVCVCKKRGVVHADGHCRRFRPDLLKVRPLPPRLPGEPEAESVDLTLEL